MSADDILVSGGFCTPAQPVYDFFSPPPLTPEQDRLREVRERAYRRSWRGRQAAFHQWWVRHWWPARIRDLEDQIREAWMKEDW